MNINGERIAAVEVRDKEGTLLAFISDQEVVTKGGVTVTLKREELLSNR